MIDSQTAPQPLSKQAMAMGALLSAIFLAIASASGGKSCSEYTALSNLASLLPEIV